LLHTKHKYGFGFPLSKYLQLDQWSSIVKDDGPDISTGTLPLTKTLKLFDKISIKDRAIAIIHSLLSYFDARIFASDYFFMLELNGCADEIPPAWASYFDKMKGIIREPGRLIVQIPTMRTTFSVQPWYNHIHPYLRFIDAVYVCRESSVHVQPGAFSDVLGGLEQTLATDLHAILIAGLSILSVAGGNGLIEKLVMVILGVKLDPIQCASPNDVCDDWQVRNRRWCPCNENGIHRPLSPIAAAKAVGMDIWRIRQVEMVTRVWDLDEDILVNYIEASKVIFVTHRWSMNEIGYQDIMKMKRWRGHTVSRMSEKLRRIRNALLKQTKYVWIDTICIDKSNLSELDEAIRSMYKWYASCAAVMLDSGTPLSMWCKRRWCLQEGAAAGILRGISKKGNLATMQELAIEQHHDLCTLDLHLYYQPGNAVEILVRMDARHTTNVEDMAYASAALLSIHLPLAYGEGLNSRKRLFHGLAT
jgi:Heterokaryon incompatibility protein (HET)